METNGHVRFNIYKMNADGFTSSRAMVLMR